MPKLLGPATSMGPLSPRFVEHPSLSEVFNAHTSPVLVKIHALPVFHVSSHFVIAVSFLRATGSDVDGRGTIGIVDVGTR